MINTLQQLFAILDKNSRLQFLLLLIPMAFVTALEVVSIGLILPVIQIILPGQPASSLTGFIFKWIPESSPGEQTLWIACIFAGFFLIKNFLLLVMIFIINKVVAFKTALFTSRLFEAYLARSLNFHFQNNSALLLRNSTTGVGQALGAVRIALLLGLDLMLMTGAIVLLIAIEPEITLGSVLLLSIVSLIFFKVGSPIFRHWGERAMFFEGGMIRWINQSFNGIRDVKLFHANNYLIERVKDVAENFASIDSRMTTSVQIPRLLIETIVVIGFLGIILIFSSTSRSPQEIVSVMGVFGMAALRLMPSLNRVLTAATQLRQRAAFISTIHEDLLFPKEAIRNAATFSPQQKLTFTREIRIDGLSYAYPDSEHTAVKDVSFTIEKGQAIGFVGFSGAGKSTLMDVILGFLEPECGRIQIDHVNAYDNTSAWQQNIGYVPQQIFILDDTLRRNIAFAVNDDDISDERIKTVLKMTQLEQFVFDLPQGLDTMLGEHGTRISGGQRQRIAIARALYHDPNVLVFDEATSALDSVTEKEISRSIETLAGDKTILIVAHRLSTVRKCNKVVLMKDGRIEAVGSYDELLSSNEEFRRLAQLGETGNLSTENVPS